LSCHLTHTDNNAEVKVRGFCAQLLCDLPAVMHPAGQRYGPIADGQTAYLGGLVMLKPIRQFVRQCPLIALGVVTLAGTAATAAISITVNPPELAREHNADRRRSAVLPITDPSEIDFYELYPDG
jgi:hypothetical protein